MKWTEPSTRHISDFFRNSALRGKFTLEAHGPYGQYRRTRREFSYVHVLDADRRALC